MFDTKRMRQDILRIEREIEHFYFSNKAMGLTEKLARDLNDVYAELQISENLLREKKLKENS